MTVDEQRDRLLQRMATALDVPPELIDDAHDLDERHERWRREYATDPSLWTDMSTDPFEAGVAAAQLDMTIAECPFGPTDPEGLAWRQGWIEAESNRRVAAGTFGNTPDEFVAAQRMVGIDPDCSCDFCAEARLNPGSSDRELLPRSAGRAGWTYGTNSKYAACRLAEHWKMHHPMFVDNEYHDYDHARHVEVVSHWHPKYATVKDVMTEAQCVEAGIDFAPFGQIIEWADELREHADNVILIPKYPEAIDEIPGHFMLGYSIPTSHGGTPIPTERFKGRKVHLLGGTPLTQLNYWHKLADEVVSIDNNSLILTSRMGMVYDEHGDHHKLSTMVSNLSITNAYYCALVISLGNVASWYGLTVEDVDVAEGQLPDRDGGESHD